MSTAAAGLLSNGQVQARRESLIPGVNIPLPPSPSPQKSGFSSTQIPVVQSQFYKVSRPSDQAAAVKRLNPSIAPATGAASASSINGTNRLLLEAGQPTRQLSITSTSDVSSLAARRAMKHSREPLLPIGVGPRTSSTAGQSTELGSPTSSGRVRNSLDKIFKRATTGDASPTTPKYSSSPRPSPLQATFAPADIEMHSPRSPRFVGQSGDPYPGKKSPSAHSASRTHKFSPIPPPDMMTFVSVASPRTGKPKRNYQDYPSRNTFFLGGRLLTGGDTVLPFVASLLITLGIGGTWFGTTAVWWWKNESPAVAIIGVYLFLITVSSMLATAFRDPGILPRNLDPDPPYPATSPSDGSPRQPLHRDLRIGEATARIKYCATCKTYRAPRSIHCKACDNCVDACDHHCQWVNNCIGRRNYTSFITFIIVATITLVLVIVTSALNLAFLCHKEHISFLKALNTAPGSAVVFCLGIAVIGPLSSLLGFHLRLLVYNTTTVEQIRKKAERKWGESPAPNPWSFGRWYRNMAYMLCHPAGYSWIEASAVTMEDRRQINPGAYELLEVEG